MSSSRFTLDVLVTDDRKVLIQVLCDPAEANGPREAVWTATFTEPHVSMEELSSGPPGWSPESENPMEQVGQVIGRVINLQQKRDFEQLSVLLHLALHNLLEAAKSALKEG